MKEIMESKGKYPRVLIINHSRINKADAHGVSIRTWFGDWPHENLAQIYSGGESGEEVFCKYNFKLSEKERRWGKFFFKIKGSSLGQSSYSTTLDDRNKKLNKISFFSLLKYKASWFLINTGLWELIFKPKLSDELIQFVKQFQPQVIYCQGYNLTFTWLPVMVHKEFKIPVCFQTGDDWPAYLYEKSPIYFLIKPIIHRSVVALLSVSAARLSNGKLMSEEYFKRYRQSFEPIMMCDDTDRFRKAVPKRITADDTVSIIYSGSLANDRWGAVIELCEAAKLAKIQDRKIMVTAFTSVVPKEAVNRLNEIDNLQILPGPSHAELPSLLKGGDILFLPETFDEVIAQSFSLSISTKAHLYMMSEKPVLIYASPLTGIVDYAKTEGWAHIVQEKDLNQLSEALRTMITDTEYCNQLVQRGIEVAAKNHDKNVVRARFLKIMSDIAL